MRGNIVCTIASIVMFIIPCLKGWLDSDKSSIVEWLKADYLDLLSGIFSALIPWFIKEIIDYNKRAVKTLSEEVFREINQFKESITDQMDVLKRSCDKQTDAINQCPRMVAFHTENNILERRVSEMTKMSKPNHRWLMSKYISKLLSVSINDFAIKINAQDYSKFSSSLIRECELSVKLTGSMRPYEWLNALGNNQENKKSFFNNELISHHLLIDEDNHSVILTRCNNIAMRKRVVCFNDYDWKYLFLSEISIDEYFYINGSNYSESSLQTYFANYCGKNFNPMKYEYALYDDALLLKWDRKEQELRVVLSNSEIENEKKEFEAVKSFFSNNNKGEINLYTYDDIKKRILETKIKLLETINQNPKLPHKLSYLYSEGGENWINYVRNENSLYSSAASDIMKMCIRSLIEDGKIKQNGIKILEIGPGDGNRSLAICDCFGADNISYYGLVDISSYLLQIAQRKLSFRLNKDNIEVFQIDWTDKLLKRPQIKDKVVIIPYNSTLFTESDFEWSSLRSADSVLLSLDIYDETNADEIFGSYVDAYKLFLHPLRIFEIPIKDEVIVKNKENLFEASYDENTMCYNVYFRLKEYLSLLEFNTENIKNRDQKYAAVWKEFIGIEKLLVLSSLKFKDIPTAETYFHDNVRWAKEVTIKNYHPYMVVLLKK